MSRAAGATPSYLTAGGQMADRIRSKDWSNTPLGSIDTWPQSLMTATGIMLAARSCMAIGWGPEFTLLYNDAWSALIGDRHHGALGRPARLAFPRIWERLGADLDGVLTGQGAVEVRDQRLRVNRSGDVEDAWFSYSLTPIPRADGSIGGVFCVAAETTDRVRPERELRQSQERFRLASTAARIGTYTRNLETGEDVWTPELLAIYICLEVALEVTGSRVGFVGEVGSDGLLHDIAISDVGWAECCMQDHNGHRRSPGDSVLEGLCRQVIDEGRSFFTNDPPSDPDRGSVLPGPPPLTSFLGVPLTHEGKTIGILAVTNREAGYSLEHREDLEALAPAVVQALVRTRAAQALRENEGRFQAAIKSSALILAQTDRELRYRWIANPHPDFETATVIGKRDDELDDSEGTRHLMALKQQVLDGGAGIREELRFDRSDGTRFYDIAIEPLRNAAGEVVGVSSAAVDITDRKQAEEGLRRYAERLALLHEVDESILSARSAAEVAGVVVERVSRLVDCLGASVTLYDLETRGLTPLAFYSRSGKSDSDTEWRGSPEGDWDDVVEKLKRGEAHLVEDLQTWPSSPLLAQLQAEGVRAHISEPIRIQGQLVGTLNLGLKEPGPLPVEHREVLRGLALHLAVGLEQARLFEEVQRYAGELEELVQRRTAALEASQARFRTIFEEAGIGIALVGTDGHLAATNPALQRMLGCEEQELAGMSFFDLWPGLKASFDKLGEGLAAGQRREQSLELQYQRQGQETGEAIVTLSPLGEDGEEFSLVLVLIEDITERKRTQEALIQAERLSAMGRMAASLAHEINNPLQAVVGCLGLAMELQEEGEDTRRYMDVALEEVERAATMVRRMRDLGLREDSRRERIGVGELLERVLALTRNQAQIDGVEVVWEDVEELPAVPMVRDRVQQVFLNLVLNAIDAMPEGGTLRVRASHTAQPPGVQVSFTDTGPGIEPGEMEQIFEAFHSTKEQGMGLGLFVSRNIVQDHGGWIDVQSDVGKGATFVLWLPTEEPGTPAHS